MKVIFLDIDGVLSPHNRFTPQNDRFPYHVEFAPAAVQNLKTILDQTGAKLVLSTRWVNRLGFANTALVLASHGINGPYVIGQDVSTDKNDHITPHDWLSDKGAKFYGVSVPPKKMSSDKCHEISFWLSDYAEKIDGYCVIDDDHIPGQDDYLVQIDGEIGLTEKDVKKVISVLNSGMKKYQDKIASYKNR
jgi:hypothetical protein